ncbi:sugar phosphate isomerase/epimerase family protein [Desulfatirhabdium butyrativorans]|uniref:sugar phosphate isomerase/epimerase family protein n=1 Tax=Desulfatirhabdium butyrativorans TaxID=340467 RepID=UPI000410D660|nr:sugar phosphate isomerase/epimerase family protein [Desulfatirhabdium butyrativorans]
MIFGYSTNAYTKYSLEESIARIAALGFSGIEIMCDRPHLYPPDYDDAAIERLANLLHRHALKVTNLNSFTLFAVGDTYLPSWIEPEAERRAIRIAHTEQCLRLAKRLGCANISVPPGGPLGDQDRAEAIERFYSGLDRVAPLAESLGVKLLIEPEPHLLLERTGEFLEFIRPIRSQWIGLNFDIGHFFCAGEDPAEAMETLFPWIGHMHIEDIGADRAHRHLIAGKGAIDFRSVFRSMKSLGYDGPVSLELYPYTDMPDEAGAESRSVLLPLMIEAGLSVGSG